MVKRRSSGSRPGGADRFRRVGPKRRVRRILYGTQSRTARLPHRVPPRRCRRAPCGAAGGSAARRRHRGGRRHRARLGGAGDYEPGGVHDSVRIPERGARLRLHGRVGGHRRGRHRLRRALQEPVGRCARRRADRRHACPGVRVRPRDRGALRAVLRLPVASDDPHHRRGGQRHLRVRPRLHGGLPGPRARGRAGPPAAVLRAHVRIPLGHVRHRVREQHGVDVHRLGGHHGVLLPAHRLHPHR